MKCTNNILIIGCGAVAQCSIPLILKHIKISPDNIIIIDPVDTRHYLPEQIKNQVQFKVAQITKDNYSYYLSNYLQPGDICIDLANDVDTYDILMWCQQHKVRYLNTALNHWPTPEIISYYPLYKKVRAYSQKYTHSPTAVITHGANPGLISSFVKQALCDAAQQLITKKHPSSSELMSTLHNKTFAELAHLLDIKIIHVAEQDTQIINRPFSMNEFLNTWSTVEFIGECLSTAEFAWGTHEHEIPENAHIEDGNIFFKNKAFTLQAHSWVPYENFSGMVIPHDEVFSIADYLSLKHETKYIYRPSVLFVYDPCPVAKESLKTFTHQVTQQSKKYVIKQEIIDGTDKMGCLLMSPYITWWTGTLLSIQESNRILPGNNATVLQVAAGVLSGLQFIIENPHRGVCFPEQLDHVQVLEQAKPYLGEFLSLEVAGNAHNNFAFSHYAKKT